MGIGVLDKDEIDRACQFIARQDDEMLKVMEDRGPLDLHPRDDHFRVLCESIIGQQLSMKAYASILIRFDEKYKDATPKQLIEADHEDIRSCGLSNKKVEYIKGLSEFFDAGAPDFQNMVDEEIVESLITIKGIGKWTVEMFLIFALNRANVFPIDDLGLRKGMAQIYRYDIKNIPAMEAQSEYWEPWRTVGTLYVWKRLGNTPW